MFPFVFSTLARGSERSTLAHPACKEAGCNLPEDPFGPGFGSSQARAILHNSSLVILMLDQLNTHVKPLLL